MNIESNVIMDIGSLTEHGTIGILLFFVWKLWESKEKLTNTLIENNSRSISVINGLKNTIEDLNSKIEEIKSKLQ